MASTATLSSTLLASDDDKMEIFAGCHSWSSVNSTGNGTNVRLNRDVMRGFGVGIPLNEQFTLNGEFLFGDPSTAITPGSNATADMMLFDMNIDYKIREREWSGGRLAPYITAGIGTMNFNQDVTGGIDEWDMSYNAGVGLYWDTDSEVFLKLAYRLIWVDMDVTNKSEMFDGVSFAIGLSF